MNINELAIIYGLYIGHQFRYYGSLLVVRTMAGINWKWNVEDNAGNSFRIDKCQLFLRPVSSLTDEERDERDAIIASIEINDYADTIRLNAELTMWFTKKGFDVFKLIDRGHAIDSTTLHTQ